MYKCCLFIEYFPVSKGKMLNIYNEAKEKGAIQARFQGKDNSENILQMRFDYADDGLLFNLPDIKLYV